MKNIKKTSRIVYALIVVLFFCNFPFSAHAGTGTIDAVYNTAKFMDTANGTINFKCSNCNITVEDSKITGYVWGDNTGWINFSPTNGGVLNNIYGTLSGNAWGQNTGWINFNPANSGVSISLATGEFTGAAWSQNYGWIKFDCSSAGKIAGQCVVTDWKPTLNITSSSSATTTLDTPVSCDIYPNTPDCVPSTNSTTSTLGTPTPTPTPTETTTTTTTTGTSGEGTPTGTGYSGTSYTNPAGSTSTLGTPTPTPTTSVITVLGVSIPVTQFNNPVTTGVTGVPSTPSVPVTVSNIILSAISYIVTPQVVNQVTVAFNTPTIKIITPIITTAGAVTSAIFTIIGAVAVPFTAPGLATIPLRLWTLLLSMLGLKKKEEKWGSVYDAVTMQPLDPVYVVLLNEHGEEVATSITDLDGRYGFPVEPGKYTLVANKTDYLFPSEKLMGKSEDILHSDLYFGAPITINEAGEVITKNIPMDSLKFNWNEFAKNQQNLMHFYNKRAKILARISDFLFDVGFVTATLALVFAPIYWNTGIFFLYILLLVLRNTKVFKIKKTGSILNYEGNPLPFAIMRVYSATVPGLEIIHRVADQYGNFYCLLPNGNYIVKIEEKTGELTYKTVFTSDLVSVTKGIIDTKFIV